MESEKAIHKRRCAAMIGAGVYSADSQEGIDFCVDYCPYDYCVVMEHQVTTAQVKRNKKVAFAKDLRQHKVSVADIALIMSLNPYTVRGYLKK